MDHIWHWIVHVSGVDYGVNFGKWVWYNFWSGIAGSFFVNMIAFMTIWYLNHTCHDSWRCWRWGKYPAAGGIFRTCWRHHPESDGSRRPRRDMIHRMHHEWRGHHAQP